jgi:SAM-dependent methyltransferase
MPRSLADRSRDWYEAHARSFDRHHPGLPGDREFYAGLAEDRRVLEIGAGTGRVTEAMAAEARSVVAIEYAAAMLRRAAGRLAHLENVRLLLADARALPLLGEFDLVALPYRVIHHLEPEERRRLWRSLAALLAENGRVAFDSWHGPAPASRAGRGTPPPTTIGTAELRAELEGAGLAVVRATDGFDETGTDRSFVRAWIARARFRAREHIHEVVDSRPIAP